MTPQPTATPPGDVRPVPPEARHRHDSGCFWDVDECHWQCVTDPLLGRVLDRGTATGRSVTDSEPETRP